MSDLDELPDLAGDVRERVVTPPYDAGVPAGACPAAPRRRRSVAAAVLVVGGVAVWQNVATTAGPSVPQPPTHRRPDPADRRVQWRAVVDGTDAHPFEVEGTDDGSIAVVWRALEHPEPDLRPGDPRAGRDAAREAARRAGLPHARPRRVGRHVLLARLVHRHRRPWTTLAEPAAAGSARAGDVFVHRAVRQLAVLPGGPDALGAALPGDRRRLRHAGRRHLRRAGPTVARRSSSSPRRQATSVGSRGPCVIAG